jgi:hypothetical protein
MKLLLFLVAITLIILKTTKAESSFTIVPKKVETEIKAVQHGKIFFSSPKNQ